MHLQLAAAKNIRTLLSRTATLFGSTAPVPSWVAVRGKRMKVGQVAVLDFSKVESVILIPCVEGALIIYPQALQVGCIFVSYDELKLRFRPVLRSLDGRKGKFLNVLSPPSEFFEWLLQTIRLRLQNQMVRNLLIKDGAKVRAFTGVSTRQQRWEQLIVQVLTKAKDKYYNSGRSLVSDVEYDYLEAMLAARNPKSPILTQVGTAPTERMVELPAHMGSLAKVKNGDESVKGWVRSRAKPSDPVVVSDKLDGASALLVYKSGKLVAAYSRGDHTKGQVITQHMRAIHSVPSTIKASGEVMVRGEVIMKQSVYNKKYKDKYANPRNMMSGQINRKTPNTEVLRDSSFIAHSLVAPIKPHAESLSVLKKLGFEVVRHRVLKASQLADAQLNRLLIGQRKSAECEMDGLVLTINNDRALKEEVRDGNPQFSVAFKDNSNTFIGTVGHVEYRASRLGYYKPRGYLDPPVKHGGVTNTKFTCHNARYVFEEGIGPGAKVEMVRSGDVIPYVVRVVKAVKPQMPPKGTWVWNETGVDIMLKNKDSKDVIVRGNAHFFSGIGVDDVGIGIVQQLYSEGYTSVPDILNMSLAQFGELEGFQQRKAQKTYKNIHTKLNGIDLPKLAAASGVFDRGIGNTLLYRIWEEYGDQMFQWKGWTLEQIVEELSSISGIGVINARKFAEGVPAFLRFWKAVKKHVKLNDPEDSRIKVVSKALEGETFVFTGFRDAGLEERIVRNGGTVGSGVNKDTTMLVAKDPSSGGSKAVKARQLGKKIVDQASLVKYLDGKKAR